MKQFIKKLQKDTDHLKKMISEPASKEWFEKYGNSSIHQKKHHVAKKMAKKDNNDIHYIYPGLKSYEEHRARLNRIVDNLNWKKSK